LKQEQEDLRVLTGSSSFETAASSPPTFKDFVNLKKKSATRPPRSTKLELFHLKQQSTLRSQSTSSIFPSLFSSNMPIDSGLNTLLSVLALSDATKAAVAQGLTTCEDLEDLFLALAADKTKVEAMLRHIVDEKIVSDI
jgi:hypothetical protein